MLRRTLCARQEKKQVGEEKGEIERETETHEYPQLAVRSTVEGGSVETGWMKDEAERLIWPREGCAGSASELLVTAVTSL